jgi:hypothetical protein
MVLVASK